MKNSIRIACFLLSISVGTQAYSQQPILALSDTDVREVFNLIFNNLKANSLQITTAEDKKKAIFFMRQLIDGSCDIGLIHGVFKASYKFKPNVKKIVNVFVKHKITDCDKDEYYVIVRDRIAVNFKSAYAIRLQTGEWDNQ